MRTENRNIKIEKVRKLYNYFREKNDFYMVKSRRARNDDKRWEHYQKSDFYFKLWRRADRLKDFIRSMENPEATRWVDNIMIKNEYEGRLRRKAEGKEKYMTKHRCSKWFLSDSFGADYGEHICDKCGDKFYHSPSTIKRAGEVVYECCCGYCTNNIIQRDWGETIYE